MPAITFYGIGEITLQNQFSLKHQKYDQLSCDLAIVFSFRREKTQALLLFLNINVTQVFVTLVAIEKKTFSAEIWLNKKKFILFNF